MVNFPAGTLTLQACSFGFFFISWHYYLFYNGFSSIRKFWSCCCLSSHWLYNKQMNMQDCWLFTCSFSWTLGSLWKCIILVGFLQNWLNWSYFLFLKECWLVILRDYMIFLSLFLDVSRMSMSAISFLAQLDSGIFCL